MCAGYDALHYLPAMPVIRGRGLRAGIENRERAMRILCERGWRRIRLTMGAILYTYGCDITRSWSARAIRNLREHEMRRLC